MSTRSQHEKASYPSVKLLQQPRESRQQQQIPACKSCRKQIHMRQHAQRSGMGERSNCLRKFQPIMILDNAVCELALAASLASPSLHSGVGHLDSGVGHLDSGCVGTEFRFQNPTYFPNSSHLPKVETKIHLKKKTLRSEQIRGGTKQ